MEMEGVMGTSKNVNPDSMTPMYKQIIDILSRKMDEGELKPGDRIPSEAELMQTYHVSRITVRSAINELEEWSAPGGKGPLWLPGRPCIPWMTRSALPIPVFRRERCQGQKC